MKDEKKIAEGFLPHSHSEMLRELKFKEPCFAVIYSDGMVMTGNEKWVDIMLRKDSTCIKAISYQQAEEWLWEKHEVIISITLGRAGTILSTIYGKDFNAPIELIMINPITAKQKGILKAIGHLHKQ